MWDSEPLKADVERLYGREQLSRLQLCLDSIGNWRYFPRFHFNEAQRLIKEALGDRDELEVVWEMFSSSGTELALARTHAFAHITACVHAMHAWVDSMGHAIYFATGMNLDRPIRKERDICLASVAKQLEDGELKSRALALVDHPGFLYLSEMNNHSKHRSLIPVEFSISMDAEQPVPNGLMFKSFKYGENPYPQRWVEPTLVPEFNRQEVLLSVIGEALNEEVGRMAGTLL